MCGVVSPLPSILDVPSVLDVPQILHSPQSRQSVSEQPKKATFSVEIHVEHDKRTGKNQVISTATVTAETIQEKGLKVYEDARKSVYALQPDGSQTLAGAVGEMTLMEVEELLRLATEVPGEVQFHPPVYSAPYAGTSRPSTPRTPNKSPSPSCFQRTTSPKRPQEGNQTVHNKWNPQSKTSSPNPSSQVEPSNVAGQSKTENPLPQLHTSGRSTSNTKMDVCLKAAALVSVTAKSEGMPVPIMPLYRSVESEDECTSEVDAQDGEASLDPVNGLAEGLRSGPVTMIFMGYEKADDEEEDDVQAELIVIDNSDDDNDECQNDGSVQEYVSYHPEGYKSKVFQPKVGVAKVMGRRDVTEDIYTDWDDLALHTPTFIHQPGKGRRRDESANSGSINMEKMKLCSTQR